MRITGIASNFFEFMNEKSFMLNSIWMKKSKVIEEDVPLKDIDVTYSKTDTDNGINEEISKEISSPDKCRERKYKKYGGVLYREI